MPPGGARRSAQPYPTPWGFARAHNKEENAIGKPCRHEDIQVHAFLERHVPHWIEGGRLEEWDNTFGEEISQRMGATCQACSDYEVFYEDWRQVPEPLRTRFALVRKNLVRHGYPDSFPPTEVGSDGEESSGARATRSDT